MLAGVSSAIASLTTAAGAVALSLANLKRADSKRSRTPSMKSKKCGAEFVEICAQIETGKRPHEFPWDGKARRATIE